MQGRGGGPVPPRFFGEADSVLAADHTPDGKNPVEQLIKNPAHAGIVWLGAGRGHEVDVDVAVPGVAKAGDRNMIFFLQPGSQPE